MKRFWLPLCILASLFHAAAYAQDGDWLSDLTVQKVGGLPYGTSAIFPIDAATLAGCRAGGSQTYLYLCDWTGKLLFEFPLGFPPPEFENRDRINVKAAPGQDKAVILYSQSVGTADSYTYIQHIYIVDIKRHERIASYRYDGSFAAFDGRPENPTGAVRGENSWPELYLMDNGSAYICGNYLWSLDITTGEVRKILGDSFHEGKPWAVNPIHKINNGVAGYQSVTDIQDHFYFRYNWFQQNGTQDGAPYGQTASVLCVLEPGGQVRAILDAELDNAMLIHPDRASRGPMGIVDARYMVFSRNLESRKTPVYDFQEQEMVFINQPLLAIDDNVYALDSKEHCLCIWNSKNGIQKLPIPFPLSPSEKAALFVPPKPSAQSLFFYIYEGVESEYWNASRWYRYDLPAQRLSLIQAKSPDAESFPDGNNPTDLIDLYCGGFQFGSGPAAYIEAGQSGDRLEAYGAVYRYHWEYWRADGSTEGTASK